MTNPATLARPATRPDMGIVLAINTPFGPCEITSRDAINTNVTMSAQAMRVALVGYAGSGSVWSQAEPSGGLGQTGCYGFKILIVADQRRTILAVSVFPTGQRPYQKTPDGRSQYLFCRMSGS
ncbi:MAG: hypothetical protein QNL02_04030 [Paracoccaceae bacterium]